MAGCNWRQLHTDNKCIYRTAPFMILQIKIGIENGRWGRMGPDSLGIRPCRLMIDRPYPGQDEADADDFNESD